MIQQIVADTAVTWPGARRLTLKTIVLLTPDEIDAAAERAVEYRPPGG